MRKQNHFRKSPNGLYAWDVHRLIELSKELTVENVPLSGIKELDEAYWFDCPGDSPTGRVIVDHMRLVMDADLSYPIILCADGGLMDGMHRVAKALLQGEQSIKAVRFLETPKPDHTDITLQELP
ncbi:MAG: hypothetical protein COA52_08020 [Hyphomicrobiales bacterium]|nr:MAG: hypothetical protein COA52_08020 [Hyphomicrobiales bacterium]